MQVPFAGFAVDPAEGLAQPGDEIIAARLVAIPPARFDALRPRQQSEFGFLYFSGFDKPKRARARLYKLARVPIAGLDAPPGELGPVVRLGGEPVHRRVAEARAQPLDELHPVLGIGPGIAEQAAAALVQRREIGGLQADRVYTLREAELREPFAQQQRQPLAISSG